MKQRLAVLSGLILCATLTAADDPTKSKATTEPVSLNITRKHDKTAFYSSDSIGVQFEVSHPGKQFLSLDPSSAITEFKDDKGTSLLSSGFFKTPFSMVNIGKDRSGMVVGVYRNGALPAKGASRIHLKGNLVTVCGLESKESEEKEIEFKKDATVTTGDYTIKVTMEKGFGGAGATITLTAPTGNIKSVTIKNADGKPVNVTLFSHFGFGKNWTYTFGLAKDTPKGKISVSYFSKTEKVTIPVDLEFGIGL